MINLNLMVVIKMEEFEYMSNFKRINIWFLINNIPLLPCVYLTLWTIASKFTEVQWIWTRDFLGFILPVILLRCFFIPYISSFVIALWYFVALIKNKFPKKYVIEFIVLLSICVMGLISVETVFQVGMSV